MSILRRRDADRFLEENIEIPGAQKFTAVILRGEDYIIRLFEPAGFGRSTIVSIHSLGIRQEIQMNEFECKTLRLLASAGTLTEAPLCEESNPLKG